MDVVLRWGVGVIAQLQQMPIFVEPSYSQFWLFITKLGDPATIFIFHAPVLFVFLNETSVFVQFMLASCISEFLNGVFKWILLADRPYWWVYTAEQPSTVSLPALKQFPPTCETGPGSPSGHCMVTAAAWIVLVLWQRRGKARVAAFMIYALALFLLALSRLYVATHFPHQVLLGAVVGAAVGVGCSKIKVSSINISFCVKLVIGLAVSAVVTYHSLQWMGIDPDWSIQLALRYCQDKSWIHMTTTPFASLFRDAAVLIGLGAVAQWTTVFSKYVYGKSALGTKILGSVISLFFAQLLTRLPILEMSTSLALFYAINALGHMALIGLYTVLIPSVVGVEQAYGEKLL